MKNLRRISPLSSGRYAGKRPSLEVYLTSPELFAAPESLEHCIKQLKDYVERGYATYQAANGPRKPLHKKIPALPCQRND